MPPSPGAVAAGIGATGAAAAAAAPDGDIDATGAGGRSGRSLPLLADAETGGTAITVVFAGWTFAGAPTPAGILIVGIPMIVAERGGIAPAAAATAAGALFAAATGICATGCDAAADAALGCPGLATAPPERPT